MFDMPDFLPSFVLPFWSRLMTWFNAKLYEHLLPQTDFLVKLAQHFDFAPLEQACAAYQHTAGPGALPTHTVSRLVRALVLKYLNNLSLRALEHEINTNLVSRWFVGYALFDRGPDHTTLARFEQWVIEHHGRLFFNEVIRQIDQAFPNERNKPQIGDTYALRANAAQETLITLLRHTCRRLLLALAAVDPAAHARISAQLDRSAIFGPQDETKEYRLDKAQRSTRLHTVAVAAAQCADLVRAYLAAAPSPATPQGQELATWLTILDKVLTDEFTLTRNAQKQVVAAQELPKAQKGSYRIGSATDPDATYRVHNDKIDFGYNINVAATDTFVWEVHAATGAQPDPVAIPDVLAAQQAHHGVVPPKFIYDAAAGAGKFFDEVTRISDGQTQLVAPPIPYDQRSERFTPADFTLSPDGATLTCPQGQVSTIAYRSGSGEGRNFRFSPQQCAGCPLAEKCRSDKVPPNRMRQVFISDHRSALAQARTYALSEDFKADMKLRATIERIIANLVRYHDARYARRRGLTNCEYQARMNALAFNLRQWMRRLDQRTAPTPAVTG